MPAHSDIRSARLDLPALAVGGRLAGQADLRIESVAGDPIIRFVRLIRRDPPCGYRRIRLRLEAAPMGDHVIELPRLGWHRHVQPARHAIFDDLAAADRHRFTFLRRTDG